MFAEGLTHLGTEFFLLSWRNATAFVLDESLPLLEPKNERMDLTRPPGEKSTDPLARP